MRKRVYELEVGWKVTVFWGASRLDTDVILDELIVAGCRGRMIRDCEQALYYGGPNGGLTYTNDERRESVVVIGQATSAREYANTISHEIGHLAVHVADTLGLDMHGEAFAYLIGDITGAMWEESHRLTCERCQ